MTEEHGCDLFIDVALVPQLARSWLMPVCIVVDVLRASTSLVWLLQRNAGKIFPVGDLESARLLASERECLLGGERGGVPPQGFTFGNRPSEFAHMDLRGQDVVFTTSNGTAAIDCLPHALRIIAGCLNNASACCREALGLARTHNAMIGIVCAGKDGAFALDDGVCAGVLVEILTELAGSDCGLGDAALAMRMLANGFDSCETALAQSKSGKTVRGLGHVEDLVMAAQRDTSQVVPVLTPGGYFEAIDGDTGKCSELP